MTDASLDTPPTEPDVPADDCEPPTTTSPIDVTAVGDVMSGDVSRDWDVTSFDGTVIRAHWFPIENLADR